LGCRQNPRSLAARDLHCFLLRLPHALYSFLRIRGAEEVASTARLLSGDDTALQEVCCDWLKSVAHDACTVQIPILAWLRDS